MIWSKIEAIMKKDPARDYFAGDLAEEIFGMENRRRYVGRVGACLRTAEKYGLVKCTGTRDGARVWRWVA